MYWRDTPAVACPLLRSPESSRISTPPGCGAVAGSARSSSIRRLLIFLWSYGDSDRNHCSHWTSPSSTRHSREFLGHPLRNQSITTNHRCLPAGDGAPPWRAGMKNGRETTRTKAPDQRLQPGCHRASRLPYILAGPRTVLAVRPEQPHDPVPAVPGEPTFRLESYRRQKAPQVSIRVIGASIPLADRKSSTALRQPSTAP